MKQTVEIVPVSEMLQARVRPQRLFGRSGKDRWHTLTAPMDLQTGKCQWGQTVSGEVVRIELFPYLIRTDSPAVTAAGLLSFLGPALLNLPPTLRVQRAHWVIGDIVEDLQPDPGVRFWIGLGLLLE